MFLQIPPVARALWIVTAFANPLLLQHYTDGLAESSFAFLWLIAIAAMLRYRHSATTAITIAGIASAFAFGTRFEAVALTAALTGSVFAYEFVGRSGVRLVAIQARLEGYLIAAIAPMAFAILLWLLFNALIEGDPLFFYRSVFSLRGAPDVARNVGASHPLYYAYGSLTGTARYVIERSVHAPLYLIGSLATFGLMIKNRDPRGLMLLLFTGGGVALLAYQIYTGSLPPWLRYWVYLPPSALVLVAYAHDGISGLRRGHHFGQVFRYFIVPVLFVASGVITLMAMRSSTVGIDEQVAALEIGGRHAQTDQFRQFLPQTEVLQQIADVLDGTSGLVLLDLQRAGPITLMIRDPGRLVVDTDRDFNQLLRNPIGRVDWILLADPGGESDLTLARNSIYAAYPGLYNGAPWLRLYREFPGAPKWRLYEVVSTR